MTRITGETVTGAPADVVFGFAAGQRNEPACHPHMARSAKVTPGPAGKGTRFRSAVRSRGRLAEMAIEYTGFQRPSRLASTTRMAQAEFSGTLTFEPAGAGTRLRWSWDARFAAGESTREELMGIRFPGESAEYRAARDRLLEQEIELRRAMEAVAVARRGLPPGGMVPDDYAFQGARDGRRPR